MIHKQPTTYQDTKVVQTIGGLLGINPSHPLTFELAARRFTPDVIMKFDIRARGQGWTYPTPQGALRFKNLNSDAPNKYAWIGDKRDTLLYGPDLRDAVEQAGGAIWLVTEFDFFAMQSAGIYHVLAQLQGEGSLAKELPAFLQEVGAQICRIAPDRDDQGTAWAKKVAGKLISVGMEVYAYELPYPKKTSHGADIGKLWQDYSRSIPFEQYLLSLPTNKLATTVEVKEKKPQRHSTTPNELKEQIARALGVTHYNPKGYSKNLSCPFHEDSRPSAALHRDFGLHCFAEGKWYKWRDLAELVGLVWEKPSIPVDREVALGDELLQAMLRAGYSALAFCLEKIYRAGFEPGQQITMKSLIAIGIPKWRARKAFSQMEGKEADKRKQNQRAKRGKRYSNFCGELLSLFLLPKEALILNKNSGRGRRAKIKVLPDPFELAQVFHVNITRYSTISNRPSIADWRAEVYALPIDREPSIHPRKELCKPLGISQSTARSYDKRAGITVTPNIHRVEIKDASNLPDKPDLKATWLETEEVIIEKDGKAKFRQFAATKTGFARALRSATRFGGSIWLVKRLANDYRRSKSGDTRGV